LLSRAFIHGTAPGASAVRTRRPPERSTRRSRPASSTSWTTTSSNFRGSPRIPATSSASREPGGSPTTRSSIGEV